MITKTKILLGILFIGVLVVSGAISTSASNQATDQRVYVLTENPAVKIMLGVNHEFPGAFSTNVSPQLKALSALGLIKTEPVQIYQITGKPVCGNGIIEGGEKCGEPGLSDCPEGTVCENCKCVTPEELPVRECYPTDQTPWGIAKVNGGSGGAGVTVAVLDTGVYKDHLDLKANIIDCKDATKRGIRKGCADSNGHGTHVAGTISANGGDDGKGIFGVAPEAKLMAIKVCGPDGCWTDDIAAGIRYATDNGADIISMSLGGDTQSSLIKDAIDDAVSAGVLVVAAAGNDREDGIGSIDYPGAYVKVVAVAAFNSAGVIASFSSLGVNDNDWFIEEKEIEFAAPGVSVESTWKNGCYNTISGTSMATPHIAGIAARDWQNTADETRVYLQDLAKNYTENVKDYGQTGDDIEAGFGLPIAPINQ
jgi:subtilisin